MVFIFDKLLLGAAALLAANGNLRLDIGHARAPVEMLHARMFSIGNAQISYLAEVAASPQPGDGLMLEPGMRLFVVECRHNGGQATTFYVPALTSDGAILRARIVVHNTRAQDSSVFDPFGDPEGLEVRVGTFSPSDRTKVDFGDWSLVPQ